MSCVYCKQQFDNFDLKPFVLFPCCHSICLKCINDSKEKCLKCHKLITSKLIKRASNELNEINHEKLYQNKYKEICFLDSGSFGCVYLVKNIENNKFFALKSVQTHFNFLSEEINLLMKLQNPFIVCYSDAFQEGLLFCILTEYCENGNLAKKIDENLRVKSNFSSQVIYKWINELLNGIEYLHSNKVIHRDIKPANIFICLNNQLKIGDFGLARTLDSTTAISTVAGTFKYMSPEVRAMLKYSYKTDIWSLGCILFELIMLEKFFDYFEQFNLIDKIEKKDFFKNVNALKIFQKLLNKMLVLDPKSRFNSNQLLELTNNCNLEEEINEYTINQKKIKRTLNKSKVLPRTNISKESNPETGRQNKVNLKDVILNKYKILKVIILITLLVSLVSTTIILIKDSDNANSSTIIGHSGPIRILCSLPKSNFASGGDDGLVIIWKSNNSIIKILIGHTNVVRSLIYLRNNSIASGSDDLKIIIWDVDTGLAKLNLTFHTDKIVSFAQLPNDNLVSASWDQYLAIWNVTTGELVNYFKEHSKPITSIILMSNNKFLVSGSHDRKVGLWNINMFDKLNSKVIIIGDFNSFSVEFQVEKLVQLTSNSIAIGYENSEYISLHTVVTAQNIFHFGYDKIDFKHNNGISSLVLLSVNLFASASKNDNTIKIWNFITNRLSYNLIDHFKPVTSLIVLENGMLVSASEDSTIIMQNYLE